MSINISPVAGSYVRIDGSYGNGSDLPTCTVIVVVSTDLTTIDLPYTGSPTLGYE